MNSQEAQQAVEILQARNTRVEADKAWETSLTRRAAITIGTYAIVGGYLSYLNVENAWLHALVPPMAYVLSTLSLPFIRGFWIKNLYKPKEVSS